MHVRLVGAAARATLWGIVYMICTLYRIMAHDFLRSENSAPGKQTHAARAGDAPCLCVAHCVSPQRTLTRLVAAAPRLPLRVCIHARAHALVHAAEKAHVRSRPVHCTKDASMQQKEDT